MALGSGVGGVSSDSGSGVARKKGTQKGQLHGEEASAWSERETGREAWMVRNCFGAMKQETDTGRKVLEKKKMSEIERERVSLIGTSDEDKIISVFNSFSSTHSHVRMSRS